MLPPSVELGRISVNSERKERELRVDQERPSMVGMKAEPLHCPSSVARLREMLSPLARGLQARLWFIALCAFLAGCDPEPLLSVNGLDGAAPRTYDESLLGLWRVIPDIDPENPPRRMPREVTVEVTALEGERYGVVVARGRREWAFSCTPYEIGDYIVLDCIAEGEEGGEGYNPPHAYMRVVREEDKIALELMSQGWAMGLHDAGELAAPYTAASGIAVILGSGEDVAALLTASMAEEAEGAWNRFGAGLERIE